jgi:hypothetical protein
LAAQLEADMGILDNLSGVLKNVTSGNAAPADVHAAFDQVASAVPQASLADGLIHAFNSDKTPPFEQMVSGLFGQSNPDQKAGLLNHLLASLGPAGITTALASVPALSGLSSTLAGGSVTPQQAQQVPPEAVNVLAQQAAAKDPSIVDKAAGFYAQHPMLVKAVGAGALALLMSKISSSRR